VRVHSRVGLPFRYFLAFGGLNVAGNPNNVLPTVAVIDSAGQTSASTPYSPNVFTGFGRLQLDRALPLPTTGQFPYLFPPSLVIHTQGTSTDAIAATGSTSRNFCVGVTSSTTLVRFTLVWTDPAASALVRCDRRPSYPRACNRSIVHVRKSADRTWCLDRWPL
jgi:hypothetical protein